MTEQSNIAMCDRLLRKQLFPLLEWSFREQQSPFKNVHNQVAGLVQFWSRNSFPITILDTNNLTENGTNLTANVTNQTSNNYSKYLATFWTYLTSFTHGLLSDLERSMHDSDRTSNDLERTACERIDDFAARNINLLLSLRQTVKVKKQKVKFIAMEMESNVNCDISNENVVVKEPNFFNVASTSYKNETFSNDLNVSYKNDLNRFVYETCRLYVTFIRDRSCRRMIDHLKTILSTFESREFLQIFSELCSSKNTTACLSTQLMSIYVDLFKSWLMDVQLASESCVDLVFLLFKYLQDDEDAEEEAVTAKSANNKNTIMHDLVRVSKTIYLFLVTFNVILVNFLPQLFCRLVKSIFFSADRR